MELKIKKLTSAPRFNKVRELNEKKEELGQKYVDMLDTLCEEALSSEDEKVRNIAVEIDSLKAEIKIIFTQIEAEENAIEKEIFSVIEESIHDCLGVDDSITEEECEA